MSLSLAFKFQYLAFIYVYLQNYLEGYWKKNGVKAEQITTRHVVRNVDYNNEDKLFTVRVTDLRKKTDSKCTFDYVIVASGHFSTPNVPSLPGLDSFRGRVMHSHDFRNAREFTGQRLLVVGGHYSAEDLALQCYKFGAEQITISYRTQAQGFKWPDKVREVPLERIEGKTCYFKDGSSSDVDAIILCTGYLMNFPFLSSEYRLECANIYYPPNLYRGVQWYGVDEGKKHADGRLFYCGMNDQVYSFTMFEMQARWITTVIKGLHTVPAVEECVAEVKEYYAENPLLTDTYKGAETQNKYLARLAADIGYEGKLDTVVQFVEWLDNKEENILTYRDKNHVSPHTGRLAPIHPVPWLECFDDSLEGYVNCC